MGKGPVEPLRHHHPALTCSCQPGSSPEHTHLKVSGQVHTNITAFAPSTWRLGLMSQLIEINFLCLAPLPSRVSPFRTCAPAAPHPVHVPFSSVLPCNSRSRSCLSQGVHRSCSSVVCIWSGLGEAPGDLQPIHLAQGALCSRCYRNQPRGSGVVTMHPCELHPWSDCLAPEKGCCPDGGRVAQEGTVWGRWHMVAGPPHMAPLPSASGAPGSGLHPQKVEG